MQPAASLWRGIRQAPLVAAAASPGRTGWLRTAVIAAVTVCLGPLPRAGAQETAPCALHLVPVPSQVAVCVDRGDWGVYEEGDPLLICGGMTPLRDQQPAPAGAPPRLRLTTTVEDNPPHVLLDEPLQSGGRCVTTASGPPFGIATARAEVILPDGEPPLFAPVTFVSAPRSDPMDEVAPTPCDAIAETVTRANQGQRLTLRVGDCLMLALGEGFRDYVWTVTITGPAILEPQDATPLPEGAQAVYEATRPGMTVLSVRGHAQCPQDGSPCAVPVHAANILIVVNRS